MINKILNVIAVTVIVAMVIAMFTSCSRYYSEGPAGSCGAWYPKKCKIGTKNW